MTEAELEQYLALYPPPCATFPSRLPFVICFGGFLFFFTARKNFLKRHNTHTHSHSHTHGRGPHHALYRANDGWVVEGEEGELAGWCAAAAQTAAAGGVGSPPVRSPIGGYSASGEHPLGEHPSHTLFVRNINSNVEDEELRALFAPFGDIRSIHTHSKHRGFVMVSYFDIRCAKSAMKHLQGRVVRRRRIDIHFSIPRDNPPERELNQGTLVVFNLDVSVTNDELRALFEQFGEVKEIRETPHKRHHKLVFSVSFFPTSSHLHL